MRVLTLFMILFSSPCLLAKFTSTELCIIKWDGQGYSLFSEKAVNDPGTPEDPTDDYVEPARGPHIAIVDINENIVVGSRDLQQLVDFNSSGELI